MEKDKQQTEKTLILMRGVPGSGKSTKAKKLAGNSGYVYSTDDFFMVKGQYVYDPKMIGQYHQKNQSKTEQAMKQSKQLIIIDNTNIKLWEMKPYVQLAQKYGYVVKIQQPQTQWAWNYKQCAKKNSHGVPEDKIQMMIDNFEPYNNNLEEIKAAKDNRRRNGKK